MTEQPTEEIEDIVDDGLDMIPAPFGGLAKLLRRLASAVGRNAAAKRKAKIDRQRAVYQAAGRAAKASSDATERAKK